MKATTLATAWSLTKSYPEPEGRTKAGRAIEARLQTATSSGAEYSIISVQRLEHLIVPRFFWFDLAARDLWDWESLKEKIKAHGIRNSLLLAPMPTASTSQILGNNECFEPYTRYVVFALLVRLFW